MIFERLIEKWSHEYTKKKKLDNTRASFYKIKILKTFYKKNDDRKLNSHSLRLKDIDFSCISSLENNQCFI